MRSRVSRPMFGSQTISGAAWSNPELAEKLGIKFEQREEYVAINPLDVLTDMQQAALLSMHTDTHLRRKLARLVLGDSQDWCAPSDFAALRELKLAEKPAGYRLHKITWQGSIAASDLMKALCRKHQIHEMSTGSDHGITNFYTCSCGEWRTSVARSPYSTSNASGGHARHAREARAKAVKEAAGVALQKMPQGESA